MHTTLEEMALSLGGAEARAASRNLTVELELDSGIVEMSL